MQYRTIPASGVKLSCIGFGGMRIPKVSEDQAIATVRKAVELGVNYFETSPGYGDSEIKIGKALKGLRDKVYVSTKSHTKSAAETRKALEKSLSRLQVEKTDFYHMWFVNKRDEWKTVMKKGGPLAGARKAQSEGLIGHIGITTHAPLPLMREMVLCGEYELITVSYNAAKREVEEIVDLAGENGVGVVVMNPLAGGMLARTPRGSKGAKRPRPHIMSALGFLLANPGVTTAICGAKSPEEMEEDAAAGGFLPGQAAAAAGEADFHEAPEAFCTTCGYCMPCPFGVNIPQAMLNWNYWKIYNLDFSKWTKKARRELRRQVAFEECTQCGACIKKCPGSLPIIERLRELEKKLK